MAYSDKEGVRKVLSPDGSQDAKLGTAASLSDDEIDEAIAQADAQIDARLSGRHSVPFASTPTVVGKLSQDIAAYLATLVNRRGNPIDADDPIRRRYVRAETLLDQLANGQAELVGETGELAQASEAAVVNPLYDGQMFGLEDFGLGTSEGAPTLGGMGPNGPFGRFW